VTHEWHPPWSSPIQFLAEAILLALHGGAVGAGVLAAIYAETRGWAEVPQ
jgi:hypothetical protein